MTTRFPRISRHVPGLGKVKLATRATTRREHERRVVLFDDLLAAAQLDTIRALVAGEVSWAELVQHRRERGAFGAGVVTDVKGRRLLADAIEASLPGMGRTDATRARYRVTWRRLQTLLPATTSVGDLATVDYRALQATWGRSPSDWNNVGRFLSAFLSQYLGLRHPLRATVVEAFPRRPESPRVPDISPGLFWQIVEAAPIHVRASFVTLVLTGLRVDEYLALTREHLMPHTFRIRVPGTKTEAAAAVITVAPEMWGWIDQGVPSRVRYRWLRLHWCRACVAAGAATWDAAHENQYRGLTLNSLRHAIAQWSSDAGVDPFSLQAALRHTNLSTTEGYARRSGTARVAGVIGGILKRGA